jgi:predicted ABC-type ATPase
MSIELRGHDRFLAKLDAIEIAAPQVARESALAGANVIANACRQASPPGVASRIEVTVTQSGESTTARVTLRRKSGSTKPRRDPSQYRHPQNYLSQAIRVSRTAAKRAAARAANNKIKEAE